MVHPSTSHFSNADVALVYGEPKPRETVWVSLATSRRFARLWRICFLRWWRRLIYSSLHIQLMLCGSAILAICLTVMHFLPRSSFALLDIFLVDLSSTWQTCLRLCECSVWEPCVNSVCCVSVCVYVSVCDNVVCDATVCVWKWTWTLLSTPPYPTPPHPMMSVQCHCVRKGAWTSLSPHPMKSACKWFWPGPQVSRSGVVSEPLPSETARPSHAIHSQDHAGAFMHVACGL